MISAPFKREKDVHSVTLFICSLVLILLSNTYSESRKCQPQHKCSLGERVEWDPEEEVVSKELDNVDEANDSPVSEPLLVIVSLYRLDSLEGRVC